MARIKQKSSSSSILTKPPAIRVSTGHSTLSSKFLEFYLPTLDQAWWFVRMTEDDWERNAEYPVPRVRSTQFWKKKQQSWQCVMLLYDKAQLMHVAVDVEHFL